ncbi:acyltransferase [Nostoc sp. TCL26-01]|uniref:acyltransferase family protein n=1 Tax=Nostoc sp. TCL26-01 TaxID=2576904 RepID=UPI0015B898DE|nr:acyltransferase [Nostoc sp. TCL26-01]QLE58473.1 acyltransferase [Nostoc sp. TCL26-01]
MSKYIKPLTSLRGIAALIVVIHHFAYYGLPQVGMMFSSHSDFFRNGYLSVDFFFILSGFIMAHVYVSHFDSGVSGDKYRSYLFSRFARIYPLHLFMLLLFIGMEIVKLFWLNLPAFTGKFNLTALFANVVLLQAFDLNCPPLFKCDTYWNEPAWSISVEFVIYCVFPILLFCLLKTPQKRDLQIYITTLIGMLLVIFIAAGNLNNIIGIPAIARCGLECVLGILSYKFYCRSTQKTFFNLDIIAVIAIVWIVFIMQYNWGDLRFIRSVHDWLVLPAFSLLILAVSIHSNGFITKLLNSSIMLYLGTISYSIYMIHWFLQEFLKLFWFYKFHVNFGSDFHEYQTWMSLGLFVTAVLLIASLTYQFIELPMRSYLKSMSFVKKYVYRQ